jgi:GNAT superfamily N-acetyltransferase
MAVTQRAAAGPADYPVISDFLYGLYEPDNRDGNWLQPVWEYAYTHPWFDEDAVSRIGIWEDAGTVVGVALYELRLGEAFFQVHPAYRRLQPAMLDYAEQHLAGPAEDGRRTLRAYINDFDGAFTDLVQARGYERAPRADRPMAQLVIPDPFPPPRLPAGFRPQSLADDNDLVKMDRVLWRGFNHPGEPPADGPAGRRQMQSGPHYRHDLAIVVVAPDGAFVAYAGLWYEPVNRFGYVEPVATDPAYRRRGLGTAAVLEGIRRCGALGATVAYVGTDQPFYLAMGFRPLYRQRCWVRSW